MLCGTNVDGWLRRLNRDRRLTPVRILLKIAPPSADIELEVNANGADWTFDWKAGFG